MRKERPLLKAIGKDREYHLYEMPASVGLKIFHQYVGVVLSNLGLFEEAFRALSDQPEGEETKLTDQVIRLQPILDLLPQILTWDRLCELSKALLAGGKVIGDGIEADDGVMDDEGFCKHFARNPHEHYIALFYALAVNYPQYFDFLIGALADEGDATTPAS